ncbi:hypothetical protein U0070_015796, partial [Myodes glareolus]
HYKSLPRYTFAKPNIESDKTEFAVDTTWKYKCLHGYSGKPFLITCLKNSKWSDGQQFCFHECSYKPSIPCESPPAIVNGDSYRSSRDTFFIIAMLEKNGEKLFDLVGKESIHCTSKDNQVGIWSSPPPQCIPIVKCPVPQIENGEVESGFKCSFFLNDTITFKCKSGFTMKGSSIVWCQPNRKWSPPLPTCFRGCLPPENIHHSDYKEKDKEFFSVGQEVSYTCEPGYNLIGTNLVQCTSFGTWSHAAPTCEVKSCDAIPNQLPNGRVFLPSNLQLGAEVSFVCNK